MQIVILDGQTLNPGDLSWKWLNALGNYTVYNETSPEQIFERSEKADILLVNKVIINSALISKLKNLKYVVVTATGYNNVDVDACRTAEIPVSNVTNYGSTNVAQHVFALLLELTNRVDQHYIAVQQGAWKASEAFSFWKAPLIELAGKTMGIVGMGNIGKEVARIAKGFRMIVIYHSSRESKESGRSVSMDELIRTSDVISLNTHLNEDKAEMVNSDFLDQMKPSAYLINTARGGLIKENDLHDALIDNKIAGAGLDVLSVEPPEDDHPLLNLPNCIVTPHNAWASVEARQRMMNIVRENIESYLAGSPIHLVN